MACCYGLHVGLVGLTSNLAAGAACYRVAHCEWMGAEMDMSFEAGKVVGALGWDETEVISPQELGSASPSGEPLVIAATSGSLARESARIIAALHAAGRPVMVVSESALPGDVNQWLPDTCVHVVGDPLEDARARRVGGSDAEQGVTFAFGVEQDLVAMTIDRWEVDIDSGDLDTTTQAMRETPVSFAWNRPVVWLDHDGFGGSWLASLHNLLHDPQLGELDVVRNAPELDWSQVFEIEESTFGGAGASKGAPILFINADIGDGQALLACGYHFAPRVFLGTDADAYFPQSDLAFLMTGSSKGRAPGLPANISRSPAAAGIVNEVLGGVATSLFCTVIDRGIRDVIRHTPALDHALQVTWTAAIEELSR